MPFPLSVRTGGETPLDLIFDAWTTPAFEFQIPAGAKGEDLVKETERLLHGGARRIGPEIPRTVPFDFPHQLKAWKFISCIKANGKVRLVIPQHHV
jgi:hypothetical protein